MIFFESYYSYFLLSENKQLTDFFQIKLRKSSTIKNLEFKSYIHMQVQYCNFILNFSICINTDTLVLLINANHFFNFLNCKCYSLFINFFLRVKRFNSSKIEIN